MKKLIQFFLFIIVLFLITCKALISQTWYFEFDPSDYPLINSSTQIQRNWRYDKTFAYKNNTVYLMSYNGFALYNNKIWTYYSADIIQEKIINKNEINSKLINQFDIIDCLEDELGNLWLMTGNFVLKFDGNSFYYYDLVHLENGEKKSIYYNTFLFNSYGNILMRSSYRSTNEAQYKMEVVIFRYDPAENKFMEYIRDDFKRPPYTTYIHIIDSKKNVYIVNNLNPENKPKTTFNSKYKLINNDTIIELTYPLILNKYLNGSFISNDSSFRKELRTYLESLSLPTFYSENIHIDYRNNNLYFLINKPNRTDKYDPFTKGNSLIFIYDLQTGNFKKIKIPFIPNDTNFRESKIMSVDIDGNIAISYPGIGTYHYYPNKSKVEDDGDNDAFLVGARIWKLYPNPTSNQCRAEFHLSRSGYKGVKILISDIQGKIYKDLTKSLRYDYTMREGTVDFDISDLPSGSYYFLITSPNANDLQRVILEK